LRILQVTDSVAAKVSGLTYAASRLASALEQAGHEVLLLTRDGAEAAAERPAATMWSQWPLLRKSGISESLRQLLLQQAKISDIVHSHGLWRMAGVYAARAALQYDKPHIVGIHGMLSAEALRISRLSKLPFWLAFQRGVLQSASCLHATSEPEYDEIRSAGLRTPVAVVPNGIDTDGDTPLPKADSDRLLLFIGRLHPIKNLESLLLAWAQVANRHPGWALLIAGEGEPGYVKTLRALATRQGDMRVTFRGPVYGDDKRALYRRAHAFVLPSLSENFGLTVPEALSEGTPVICTKAAPWSELEERRCGYWVDNSVVGLAAALDRMMGLPLHEIQAMGERGRAWVTRALGWRTIASEMADVYEYLLGRKGAPACLRLT
jgi:glycosyltransferase involved in cell wall biosynthesis